MANLNSTSIDELHRDVMALWSASHIQTPINSPELRALIVAIDEGLEAAETSIVQGLPAGPERTWLVSNPQIGRWLMEETERKRRTGVLA